MELQKIVVLCLATLVVGGGAWYFVQNDSKDDVSGSDASLDREASGESFEDEDDTILSGLGSFVDLIALGSSVKCEFSVTTDEGAMRGTSYIDGKNERVRMDGTGHDGDANVAFGMISTGELVYWWSDTPEGKQGMKMAAQELSVDEGSVAVQENDDDGNAPVRLDEDVAYECDRWSVDASVFTPPSDVTFTDMNAMFQEMMQGMPEGFDMPEGFPMPQ